ncbi:MAG TPA: hypothetical protein DGR79_00605 [Clostridiales bacterium]|nr:hypothetical protein [Clostridiales bacterium]
MRAPDRHRQAPVLVLVMVLALGPALVGLLGAGGCRPDPVAGPPGVGGDGSAGGPAGGEVGGESSGEGSQGDGSDGQGQTGGDGEGDGGGEPPPGRAACPLCGAWVPEAHLLHRPLAVVVDNAAPSRPQSGLGDACLVYEVLVEGRLTRFVAFFLHTESAAIGPVRSLRPYMLDLVMPVGAVVAHVGGSPQALEEVARLGSSARSIDAMKDAGAFWHMSGRRPPFNTFTGTSLLRAASQARGYEGFSLTAMTPTAFRFAASAEDAVLPAGQSVMRFTVSYGAPGGYAVTYDYDPESGRWMRYVRGAAHIDAATERQLGATTVIVHRATCRVIPGDPEGRLEMTLTGSGRAKVFVGGRVLDAVWSKAGRDGAAVYTDLQGDPLVLPPGPVWVLVVPPESALSLQ